MILKRLGMVCAVTLLIIGCGTYPSQDVAKRADKKPKDAAEQKQSDVTFYVAGMNKKLKIY